MRDHTLRLAFAIAIVTVWVGGYEQEARADDFFKGKQITLHVGSSPGGPYDAYARMLARYMGDNIPGRPSIVVDNMPGASGRRLMGHMASEAHRDGTEIALVQCALVFDKLLGVQSPFDATKMSWIGSADSETNVCIVWHTSRIQTIDDVFRTQMTVGSSGPSSTDSLYPNVMRNLFGMKFKVIEGYSGTAETTIAMQGGEIDGQCGLTWDTIESLYPDWITGKKIRTLVQFAVTKDPDLPNVPSVLDMAKTEEQRQVISFWGAPNRIARPFFAPPPIPADRLEIQRKGFDTTLKDPKLLMEVAKTKLAVRPLTGESVETWIRQVYATPPAIVAEAARASAGQ
jgi:tripartite-type tricarboxylate transporter receptor subunit TctC